jgi:hypothetical protein
MITDTFIFCEYALVILFYSFYFCPMLLKVLPSYPDSVGVTKELVKFFVQFREASIADEEFVIIPPIYSPASPAQWITFKNMTDNP